jgi:parallel beta-helix repeat protein
VGVALLNDAYYVIGGINLPFNPFGATAASGTNAQYNPNENIPLKADTTIYIRSDGRIEPSTANITTTDKITYTFTDNNYARMIIERDNIIIDGNGHALQGSQSKSYGIAVYQRQNVTIANITSIGFGTAGIALQSSTNNSIIGSNSRTTMNNGVRLYSGASNNTFRNNVISNIAIYEGATGNVISSNHLGTILAYGGSGNIITENYMKNRGAGIFCVTSSNNTIINNYVNCDQYGINLRDKSNYNKISNNTLSSIIIENSNNNSIHHNNFVGNRASYADNNLKNIWDDGLTGNYWFNYNGTDNNGDLIGDTPHTISNNNTDNYPLMAPITVFDAGTWEWTKYYVNVISNATVFDFVFDPEQDKINFRVTTENETTGFCKVTIPKGLLDVKNNNWLVIFSGDAFGNVTTNEDTNNTYLYFNYDNQTELVEIIGTTAIPEFQQWTTPAVFMATALVTVMFYKRIQKNLK